MENFVWNEDLIKQSIRDIILKREDADVIVGSWDGLDKEFEKWKADHQKEEPKKHPSGIISFKNVANVIWHKECKEYQDWVSDHLQSKSAIHSVRNSKGIVFTNHDLTTDGRIIRFEIEQDMLFAVFIREYPLPLLRKEMREVKLHIDTLTKAKEPEQPSWKDQIVAFKNDLFRQVVKVDNNDIGANVDLLLNSYPNFKIFTVKNKAGIELSVGDDTNIGTVVKFRIDGERIMADTNRGGTSDINYCAIYHKAEKQSLFKSQDGFNIFPNDKYYLIGCGGIEERVAYDPDMIQDGLKFKEKVTAMRYLSDNAKNYSAIDIREAINRCFQYPAHSHDDFIKSERLLKELKIK